MKGTGDHMHELFMRRAMELAQLGKGNVSPNPLVGSVIVHEGRIIGEGWHKKYGGPHAEVEAINSVQDKSLLHESTVYVNLEPCSHFGKTPPCADMLVREKVKKVVIANLDSNHLVAGNGVKKLRDAGIEVDIGVLEAEGRQLNKRFFTFIEKKRPYIILKWAQTKDGFIARENGDSKWISNDLSRQLVHKWRTEEDAVLVGTNTVKNDDPKLNVRLWTGRDPVRIIIDRNLRLERSLTVFNRGQRTICYNVLKNEQQFNLELRRLDDENFIQNLVRDLYDLKIQSIIVEGGSKTLQMFIDTGLWDEADIFESSVLFEKGIRAPLLHGKLIDEQPLFGDLLRIIVPSTT